MSTRFSKYFGNYPAEYNRAKHGPYDPARFYGPRDTPLADVKLNELFAWLNRRNLHPGAMAQAVSRAHHRYLHRFGNAKYASFTIYFFQFIAFSSTIFYLAHYPKFLRHHKQYKYHW